MPVKSCFFIVFLGIWLFQGCKYISEDKVAIHGTFINLPETKLYIHQIRATGTSQIDSVKTDASGHFEIELQVKETSCYLLYRNANDQITLVISPGEEITITGDGNHLNETYMMNGSPDSRLFAEYNQFTEANLRRVDSLSAIFAESRTLPDFASVKANLDSAYLQIFNQQKERVIGFVNRHLHSLASLLVISKNFGPNPVLSEHTHPELFIKLDSTLFHTYPDNNMVNAFHQRVLGFKSEIANIDAHEKLLKPGMTAPEIALPNASGKQTKLSSLKGKLTLIYFWSSWNALCRQTNVNLTGLYNQYHNRGFEIYAVSIDSDTDLWKKAYMLDKAYWIQVIDMKGLDSDYSKIYDVRAFPKMILIGKDGKIIAGNPEFGELNGLIKSSL